MQKKIVITIDESTTKIETFPEDMSSYETLGVLQYMHSHITATSNINSMMKHMDDDIEAEVQRRLKLITDQKTEEVAD